MRLIRKLWCRLFHDRSHRWAGEGWEEGGYRMARRGTLCCRCFLWHNEVVSKELIPPLYFSKVQDPTDWSLSCD